VDHQQKFYLGKIFNKHMNLAIIPARKNSKRIKNKNIKLFFGKPIIAYPINIAKKSEIFNKIHVSTDCNKIKKIAKKYGADVPFLRSKKLSDNKTGLVEVLRDHLKKIENDKISYICLIFATSPTLQSKDLKNSLKKLKENNKALFCLSISKFNVTILKALSENKKGFLTPLFKKKIKERSQDLDEFYHEAGQFMWLKKEALTKKKVVFGKENTIGYQLPQKYVQDVDRYDDWKELELKYEIYKKLQNSKK
jgi:pseudaminic acid cytidylyltransferase